MALVKTIQNRYDGANISAFYRVKEIRLSFDENRADVYGLVYVSEDAFKQGCAPIDSFGALIPDLGSAASANALDSRESVQKWLLALADYKDATERPDPVLDSKPVEEPSSGDSQPQSTQKAQTDPGGS